MDHGRRTDGPYKTVRDHVVLLKHWRGHLCVDMIVVLDKGFIAHARLLANENGGFDHFAEPRCRRVARFENHDGICVVWSRMRMFSYLIRKTALGKQRSAEH